MFSCAVPHHTPRNSSGISAALALPMAGAAVSNDLGKIGSGKSLQAIDIERRDWVAFNGPFDNLGE
jgi:hypothetical protein